jgi:probable HAF family extracellular repeat protein
LGTPVEETPDSQGCSCAQRDDDSDGVDDCLDACPFTPTDEVPDAEGCSCSQRDGDADGVNDCIDACPDTVDSAEVGTNGCVDEPLDEDDDGVLDEDDLCPATPVGEFADEFGCSCSQTDEDTDGMSDCDDLCPETPAGSEIDINGCAVMGVSAGPDVVLDEVGCLILHGSASGGTEPYTYSWSASGWGGSMEQNPTVVPFEPTTYTLTVTDWSSPPQVRVDAVTVSFNSIGDLQYTIVNLGSPEGNSSYASGLNDQGDVVGYYYTADWKKRAYLYTQGEMTELGSLGGGEALAEDINNAGQIVGKSRTADLYWQAFLWDSSTGMQNLGTLGGASSTAYAINESGQVAGHADTATGMSAFLYGGGAMADLGSQNYLQSAFFDINATAQAAGSFVIGGSNQNAFVYDGSTIIDLGSPLLDGSRAVAINDSQLVVGYSWGGGEYRSFIQACDTVIDLGALVSFPKTYAWDINNAGQVVGNSSDEIGAPSHAFVFTGGILYDLNDLLAPGHGWEFVAGAFAVNNAGQIAGYGRIDGEYRAFLMTPVQ